MQRIKFMIRQFLNEPLWFRMLISLTLLISIVFSSSFFSNQYIRGYSKLAAAIFFCAYGIKMRRNLLSAVLLFAPATLCIYLFIRSLVTILVILFF
jgi:hypothetical protein